MSNNEIKDMIDKHLNDATDQLTKMIPHMVALDEVDYIQSIDINISLYSDLVPEMTITKNYYI